jgi:magnesium transporter
MKLPRLSFPRRHPESSLGAPPGTLSAQPQAIKSRIRVICYGPDDLSESEPPGVETLSDCVERWPVVWVNVDGLADVDVIEELGRLFKLHHLALEDVVHVGQRPKAEEYGDHLFVVTRMMKPGLPVHTEQLSIFVGKGFVLTFQEEPGDCLDPVRERIRLCRGRIRQKEADYLAYCLLDAVVDFYFPCIDAFSDEVERLEQEVLEKPSKKTVHRIHAAKRDLLAVRRAVAPLREAINSLIRDGHSAILDATRTYLRDCQDHVYQIMDMTETYRELLGGLLDVYLSSVSNRMNDVMKVLTVIATMFIPLTFLAGLYGMNFNPEASPWNMPELSWYWGYPAFLALMVLIAAVELALFWRKGWLGSRSEPSDARDDRKEDD